MTRYEIPHKWLTALAAAAMSALVAAVPLSAADTWNERTQLTFTHPVMVPGATLQPGTYTFQLAEVESNRHMVQVLKGEGDEIVIQTQAVPVRRERPHGETILTFNPSESGIPALKAWYYPHSTYGHEFIYPETQARQIAERSKTIVLSLDGEDQDVSAGALRLYHPDGTHTEWRADREVEREWNAWRQQRQARGQDDSGAVPRSDDGQRTADNGGPSGEDMPADDDSDDSHGGEARAPMMIADSEAVDVTIDELETNPAKYLDTRVTVDAEVEEVFGPRLFTIDERNWGDLDGEILVYAPTALAALVKDDDRVSVTGTMKTMALADIEREWGWFDLDPEIEVEFLRKPVLVADTLVGGDNNVALFLAIGDDESNPADARANAGLIVDPATVAAGTTDLVGRPVDLKNVKVLRTAQDHGFFIDLPAGAVLVAPTPGMPVAFNPGDTVSIQGAIASMPDRIEERVNPPSGWNRQIYVAAAHISR